MEQAEQTIAQDIEAFSVYVKFGESTMEEMAEFILKQNLTGQNLQNINLSHLNLTGLDLTFVDLSGANLEGTNLCHGKLYGTKFVGANIKGTNFQNSGLLETDFTGAICNEFTNFRHAWMYSPNFKDAKGLEKVNADSRSLLISREVERQRKLAALHS